MRSRGSAGDAFAGAEKSAPLYLAAPVAVCPRMQQIAKIAIHLSSRIDLPRSFQHFRDDPGNIGRLRSMVDEARA